jgi:hypothetical protein
MMLFNRNSVLDATKATDNIPTSSNNPDTVSVGLDIGTATIIGGIHNKGEDIVGQECNAFFGVPDNPKTMEILANQKIKYFKNEKRIYILGNQAEKAADLFKKNAQRPVKSGLLNPNEPDGVNAIKEIINNMIPADQREGARVCFSIPADPIGQEGAVVYHDAMLNMNLKSLGLIPQSINEGLAVIMSETDLNNATALGISIGGGMCNICFSYLSLPVISYSIQKGGDYIDERVGYAVNETATHIKLIKEKSLDLSVDPKARIDTALHIYYEDLFQSLARSLEKVLGSSEKTCRLPNSLPLIVSGGSMLPKGSLEKFKAAMKDINLPIKISDILLAANPAEATMRGAMKMALAQ